MVDEKQVAENIRRTVQQLSAGRPRQSGTDGEREAASRVADRLQELSFSVDRDEFKVPPGQALVITAHLALLLLAAIVARFSPLTALGLAAVVAVSLYGELSCRYFWIGRLLCFARSANVLAVKTCENPIKKVLIVARLDAPTDISGLSILGQAVTASSPVAFSLAVGLTVVFLVRTFQGWGVALAIVEGILTLAVALVAAAAARQHWQGTTTAGAVNDAAGAGVLLEVARTIEQWRGQGLEFWLLFTGAGEVNLAGMRHFFKSLFYRLDHYSTYIINIPSAGAGTLHYVTGEQRLTPIYYPPDLVYLSGRIVKDRGTGEIGPAAFGDYTDAAIGARAGYRCVSLVALDEKHQPLLRGSSDDTVDRISDKSSTQAYEFVMALIDRIANE